MSKQNTYRRGGLKTVKSQRAYILIFSLILLALMLVASLSYFEQSSSSLQISGYNRDSSESLMLAESAMNLVYGNFVFDKDLDDDQIVDNIAPLNIDNPTAENGIPVEYAYYISNGTGIDQQLPSLLQRVANGEARNSGGTGNGHSFSASQNVLLIENLFTGSAKPIVFELNSQGQLVPSTKSWATLSTTHTKSAAGWLELVRNPQLEGTIQVYVQAVSKVGDSKSYVQRLIGAYPTTLGINLGGLNESSL